MPYPGPPPPPFEWQDEPSTSTPLEAENLDGSFNYTASVIESYDAYAQGAFTTGAGANIPGTVVQDMATGGAIQANSTGITQGEALLYNAGTLQLLPGTQPPGPPQVLASGVSVGATALPLTVTPGADVLANARGILDPYTPQAEAVQVGSVVGQTVNLTSATATQFAHSAGAILTTFSGSALSVDYWAVYPSQQNGSAPYIECWQNLMNAINAVAGNGSALAFKGGTYTVAFPLDTPTETKFQGSTIDATQIFCNPNGTPVGVTSINTSTGVFSLPSANTVGGGGLATSPPTTSIPLGSGISAEWGSGLTVTLTSGAHTQTFTLNADAPAGATTLSVTSTTANFAYPPSTTTVAFNQPLVANQPIWLGASSLPYQLTVNAANSFNQGNSMSLGSSLSTAAPITSLPLPALTPLSAPYASGLPVTITCGSQIQTFKTNAAAHVGDTSLTIVSATPNFNYPSTAFANTCGSNLSTGGPITSITLGSPAATAYPTATIITIKSGSNTQTWTLTSAINVNDNSISVASQTPNFAYPSGSTLTGPASVIAGGVNNTLSITSHGLQNNQPIRLSSTGLFPLMAGADNPGGTKSYDGLFTVFALLYQPASALASNLSTGGPITSIALAKPLVVSYANSSTITVTQGTHTQNWTLTAQANIGDTSLTVSSQTPNFAYTTNSTTIVGPPDPNLIQVVSTPGSSALTIDPLATGVTVYGLPVETVLYVVNPTSTTFQLAAAQGGTPIVPNNAGSGVNVYTTAWRYVQDYPANRYNIAMFRVVDARGGLPTRYDTGFGGTGRIYMRDIKFCATATDGSTATQPQQYVNGLLVSLNQPAYLDQVRVNGFSNGYGICEVGTQQSQRHNVMTNHNMINRWYRGAEFIYEFGADAENSGRADCIFDYISGSPVTVSSVSGATITTVAAHGRLVGDYVRFSGVGAWPTHAFPTYTQSSVGRVQMTPGMVYQVIGVPSSTQLVVSDTETVSNATGPHISTSLSTASPITSLPLTALGGSNSVYPGAVATVTILGISQQFTLTGELDPGGTSVAVTSTKPIFAYPAAFSNTVGGGGLSTGSPITSIPLGSNAGTTYPIGGTLTTSSGGHTQTWTLTLAINVNDTTATVASQTPNFAYPNGSTITGSAASVTFSPAGKGIQLASAPTGMRVEYLNSTGPCTQVKIEGIHDEPAVTLRFNASTGTNLCTCVISGTSTPTPHYLQENEAIRLGTSGTPPTVSGEPGPMAADLTTYFAHVNGLADPVNTFQLCRTPGGTPVTMSAAGSGAVFQRAIASMEVYASNMLSIAENQWTATTNAAKWKCFGGAGSSQQQNIATYRLRNVIITVVPSVGVDDDDHPLVRGVTSISTSTGTFTVNSHNLVENQPVQLAAASFPTNLAANTYYFVNSTGNGTLRLRTAQGDDNSIITSFVSAGSGVSLIASGGWTGNWFNRNIQDFSVGPNGAGGNFAETYGQIWPYAGNGQVAVGSGSGAPNLLVQNASGVTTDMIDAYDSTGTLQFAVRSNGAGFQGQYQDIQQIAQPALPSSGTRRLYVDSTSGGLTSLASNGQAYSVESIPSAGTTRSLGYVISAFDYMTTAPQTIVSGTVYWVLITLTGQVINEVWVNVNTVTTSSNVSLAKVGVYSDTLAQLGKSNNNTNMLGTVGGSGTSLITPVSGVSGFGYLAVLVVGKNSGITANALMGAPAAPASNPFALGTQPNPRLDSPAICQTGLSDLPTSPVSAATSIVPWMGTS